MPPSSHCISCLSLPLFSFSKALLVAVAAVLLPAFDPHTLSLSLSFSSSFSSSFSFFFLSFLLHRSYGVGHSRHDGCAAVQPVAVARVRVDRGRGAAPPPAGARLPRCQLGALAPRSQPGPAQVNDRDENEEEEEEEEKKNENEGKKKECNF